MPVKKKKKLRQAAFRLSEKSRRDLDRLVRRRSAEVGADLNRTEVVRWLIAKEIGQ